MENNYITITEINNYIKGKLDTDSYLNLVYIKGEISNFKNHSRGHLYFTLKDENSRLSAVMFYNCASKLAFVPEDGMNVLVKGRISSYPAQGSYQIYVESMDLDGVGNLYIEYEKLKEKLYKEGLFNPEHKQMIPKYPKKIGIITAPTGAAVRDIMSTIKRRYPLCETILFPSLVQGEDAAPNIVSQIKIADSYSLDVLIVGRGGGSIEDLWAFNEEIVARAIFEAKTPIISAVGHEPDYTIADFVADLRAPTPTGAAEMAVPTVLEIKSMLNQLELRLNKSIKNTVNTKFIQYKNISSKHILKNPMSLYELKEQKLDKLIELANLNIFNILKTNSHKFELLVNTLKLVNPLNILSNGYSLVRVDDKVIKSSNDLKVNDTFEVKFYEGEIKAIVKEVK